MPKMKTHRGAAKRFRVTGTGKIRRKHTFRDHLLEHKPTSRTRRLGRLAEVTGGDKRRVKKLLGLQETAMARVKRSVNGKKSRRKTLESAKGYTGSRSRHLRAANEQVMHSLRYAYRDRRARKGEFRRLWIVRINAACRENDISYSRFIAGLKAAEVEVDRKVLADIAVREPATFGALVSTAREALDAA